MGLLDDAIREHLELKRRGGADPAVVEREELEALAPVYPDDDGGLGDEGAGIAHALDGEDAHAQFGSAHAHFGLVDDQHRVDPRMADLGGVGQDTAELDMRAVLEEDTYMTHDPPPAGPAGDAAVPLSAGSGLPDEEPFGWERSQPAQGALPPEEIPGQERLSFE
jgi:hypothetical protein